MAHAAPSRQQPTASTDLEAGKELKLGEFASEETLSLSEARIVLEKTLQTRSNQIPISENTGKAQEYLDLFAVFKDLALAEQVEALINRLGTGLEKFEKAQLKTLIPTGADEAKAVIPSLEKKCEEGTVDEEELEGICKELQRLKRQAEL